MHIVRTGVSAARLRCRLAAWGVWLLAIAAVPVSAQRLLDRVVARVGNSAITLTDVRAAIGLGLLDEPGAPRLPDATDTVDPTAVQKVIERRLALAEVARFPPADPAAPAIDLELAKMRARAGAGLDELLRSTGLDDARLREMARDAIRIQSYLAQRFGTTVQVSDDEARRYFDAHPDDFMRDGMPLRFEEVEAAARRGASDERLRASIAQWMSDLRARAEVVVTTPPAP